METWMGPDPVEQKVKELTPFWRRMQAENAARKEQDQREMEEAWLGFAVGGYAWLTEEATLRRGGMRLVNEDGSVRTEKVKIIEFIGTRAKIEAKCATRMMIFTGSDILDRKDFLEAVIEEEVIIVKSKPAVQYWEV